MVEEILERLVVKQAPAERRRESAIQLARRNGATPTSSATPQKKPDKPTYVSIKADLAVAIGETPVKRTELVHSHNAADSNKERRIFLRADRLVPYGEMMDVLELLRHGGYTKVALVALEGRPDAAAHPTPAAPPQ